MDNRRKTLSAPSPRISLHRCVSTFRTMQISSLQCWAQTGSIRLLPLHPALGTVLFYVSFRFGCFLATTKHTRAIALDVSQFFVFCSFFSLPSISLSLVIFRFLVPFLYFCFGRPLVVFSPSSCFFYTL